MQGCTRDTMNEHVRHTHHDKLDHTAVERSPYFYRGGGGICTVVTRPQDGPKKQASPLCTHTIIWV